MNTVNKIYLNQHFKAWNKTQTKIKDKWSVLIGLFGFMAYQPLQVIQRQIHFYVNNQF